MTSPADTASEGAPPLAPPETLGEAGRALWCAVTEEYPDGWRPDELRLLVDAAGTTDLVDRLEKVLADGDLVVDGSNGQARCHPAIAEIRLQRGLLATQLRSLNMAVADGLGPDAPMSRSEAGRKAADVRWGNR